MPLKIEVALFAALARYLPAGSADRSVTLEFPTAITLAEVLSHLGIPREGAHLVLVNGVHQPDHSVQLHDGDRVAVFPPLAGGSTPAYQAPGARPVPALHALGETRLARGRSPARG